LKKNALFLGNRRKKPIFPEGIFSSSIDFQALRGTMPHDPTAPAPSPFLTEAHHLFRATMRRFVAREIEPYAAAWDEAESFPRALYERAAETGLLQIGFPADYGGVDADPFFGVIAAQELAARQWGWVAP
jgi:acyl-CoA dehydrogenase